MARPKRRPPLCGVSCNAGPGGEPLACGYKPRHKGDHSWASQPTWPPPECPKGASAGATGGRGQGIEAHLTEEYARALMACVPETHPWLRFLPDEMFGPPSPFDPVDEHTEGADPGVR